MPPNWLSDPSFNESRQLLEVHELLTVSVPGIGPCRVDITWDPALINAGFPGLLEWDGRSDMPVAIGEASSWWAPDPEHLREEKEALRARLYRRGERTLRDRALAMMSQRFGAIREPTPPI